MRKLRFLIPILLPAALLAGCNTPEALIPRADVGNADSQTTAAAPEYGDGGAQASNVYTQPAAQQSYSQPPQNTLEAQAQALAAGQTTGTPPASTPRRTTPSAQQPLPPPVTSQPPAQQQQVAAASPATVADTIRFLPIIGAPVEAVTPLSRQLGSEARAHGLSIKGSSDPSTRHILKGYFSAFADGGNVNVVYVWDVLDGSGARLHRIQGQQSVRSSATDPWAGVPASVMQQIGTNTIAEYLAWKQSTNG